jgi:hypothetical protein
VTWLKPFELIIAKSSPMDRRERLMASSVLLEFATQLLVVGGSECQFERGYR